MTHCQMNEQTTIKRRLILVFHWKNTDHGSDSDDIVEIWIKIVKNFWGEKVMVSQSVGSASGKAWLPTHPHHLSCQVCKSSSFSYCSRCKKELWLPNHTAARSANPLQNPLHIAYFWMRWYLLLSSCHEKLWLSSTLYRSSSQTCKFSPEES